MSELYDRLEEVLKMNKVQIKTNSGITKISEGNESFDISYVDESIIKFLIL